MEHYSIKYQHYCSTNIETVVVWGISSHDLDDTFGPSSSFKSKEVDLIFKKGIEST